MSFEWRARVSHDPSHFALDQVHILLARRDPDGLRMAAPVEVVLGEPTDPLVQPDETLAPFLTLPTEAAEALFEVLAAHFCGTSDVVRLSRDLAAERRRVDSLIAGIGRTEARRA